LVVARRQPSRGRSIEDPPGDPAKVARLICLRKLDHRACTRSELEQALTARGIPSDVAATVLDRFTELQLIDDVGLSRAFALSRHSQRGLSRRAIAGQLHRRGVDDEVIADATSQIDLDDERAAAFRLGRARLAGLRGLDPAAQRRRLVGLLARRGYSAGMSYEITRELLQELGADDAAAELLDIELLEAE
jgi:regulatory protein